MKILILKPSSLGDVVHALPMLRLIKRQYPEAEVHWWIEEGLASFLEGDPDLAKIQIFKRRSWGSLGGFLGEVRAAWKLRDVGFDLVIDLQGLARSAWFAWLVHGERTIGIDSGREGARAFHDVSVGRKSHDTHAVEWCLDVAREFGVDVCGHYEWLPKRQHSKASLLDSSLDWVAFVPGARWPNKRWPTEYFARLAGDLQLRSNSLKVVILGSMEDVEDGEAVAAAAPDICLNLVGKTTLLEMVECLRDVRMVVANDSGPLHVAAALERPMVALYGPTQSNRTGPYGNFGAVMRFNLPCSPCLKPYCGNHIERECMKAITPDVVADAVLASM